MSESLANDAVNEENVDPSSTAVCATQAKVTGRGRVFTPVEDLIVSKTFVRASTDSVTGTGQKAHFFLMHVADVFLDVKGETEREEMIMFERPSHLQTIARQMKPVPYPPRTGSSILQRWKKRISPHVIKYMGVLARNPIKSGEDKIAYERRIRKARCWG